MFGIIFSIQNLLQYHFGQIWSYEVLTAHRRYIKLLCANKLLSILNTSTRNIFYFITIKKSIDNVLSRIKINNNDIETVSTFNF